MSGTKKVEKDHYLFRDGDPPDALYVVKSGKFAVTKTKQTGEIVLAEIGPGAMVGEMAFFDNKPRSANVKALKDSEAIMLPYKALHAQFQTFPEWAKAIMRTVNTNLREANMKIKTLEKADTEQEMFSPHTITKLSSILTLVGHRYGRKEDDSGAIVVPSVTLRNYTIQVFGEPTHKMDKLLAAFHDMKLVIIENKGDGFQKITVPNLELLFGFVEWYNGWLFKKEADRITITEPELKVVKAILHFAKKSPKLKTGEVNLSLTNMQNESMKELNYVVKIDDLNPLIEKKVTSDKIMGNDGIYCTVKIEELEKSVPYWDIIYTLKKIQR